MEMNGHGASELEKADEEETDDFLGVLLSNKTKEFVYGLYSGRIWSARQAMWDGLAPDDPMPRPPSFGPLQGQEEKLWHRDYDDINLEVERTIERLSLWYQGVNPEASIRDTYSYILGVWMPEAIKFALRQTEGLSEAESEAALTSTTHQAKDSEESPLDKSGSSHNTSKESLNSNTDKLNTSHGSDKAKEVSNRNDEETKGDKNDDMAIETGNEEALVEPFVETQSPAKEQSEAEMVVHEPEQPASPPEPVSDNHTASSEEGPSGNGSDEQEKTAVDEKAVVEKKGVVEGKEETEMEESGSAFDDLVRIACQEREKPH